MQNFPVFEPLLYGNEWVHIKRALDQNQISGTSPIIEEFEREFARFCEIPFATAAANGTAALHLALLALGVKAGDEVLLPNSTIISNALSVVLCGAKPVFVDVSASDWCLDVEKLNKARTPKTVGVMVVHLFGNCPDMDQLTSFTTQHNLWLLEDVAQAQDARWKGKRLGSFGDLATYSFYANKLITTGEGGAVTTKSQRLNSGLNHLRNLAFDPEPSRRFIHTELAHNYRMSGMQAAMGLAQLEKVTQTIEKRQQLATYYREVFSGVPELIFPKPHSDCTPSFWMCALRLDEGVSLSVPEFQKRLEQEGIGSRRFFYPLHRQPALLPHHDQTEEDFPVSEKLFDRGFYLPSSSSLTWDEVKLIGSQVLKVLHGNQ